MPVRLDKNAIKMPYCLDDCVAIAWLAALPAPAQILGLFSDSLLRGGFSTAAAARVQRVSGKRTSCATGVSGTLFRPRSWEAYVSAVKFAGVGDSAHCAASLAPSSISSYPPPLCPTSTLTCTEVWCREPRCVAIADHSLCLQICTAMTSPSSPSQQTRQRHTRSLKSQPPPSRGIRHHPSRPQQHRYLPSRPLSHPHLRSHPSPQLTQPQGSNPPPTEPRHTRIPTCRRSRYPPTRNATRTSFVEANSNKLPSATFQGL